MRISILGAGAVGAYLILGLADKYGNNLCVLARDERAKRLSKEGLTINGRRYDLNVVLPEEAGDPDILFVCLKRPALEAALPDIQAAVGEKTVVVSLMNGIDSEEVISAAVGKEHVIHSMIKISSTREGAAVHFPLPRGGAGIHLGVPGKKAADDPRVMLVSGVFANTPVICHLSDDIMLDIWDKFALNIARNLPQAVLGVGAGAYDDSVYVSDICQKLHKEVVLVARAKGIPLNEELMVPNVDPSQRYSTLQDLDAGRATEIEAFSGMLIRVAHELEILCPYNEIVYDLIKALEEKNLGKFDYKSGGTGN